MHSPHLTQKSRSTAFDSGVAHLCAETAVLLAFHVCPLLAEVHWNFNSLGSGPRANSDFALKHEPLFHHEHFLKHRNEVTPSSVLTLTLPVVTVRLSIVAAPPAETPLGPLRTIATRDR